MAKPNWEITENPKNKRWYIRILANTEPEFYPTVSDIQKWAHAKGLNPYNLFSETTLEKSLQKAMAEAGEETFFPVVIEPTFDVRLSISQDKTSASLYIRKGPDKTNPIDLKLISNLLVNSRIKGLDNTTIKEAIQNFRASPSMELTNLVIAEGINPGRGKDRELISMVDFLPEDETKELCKKMSAIFKPDPLTKAETNTAICETTHFAHVIKGTIVYELSPTEQGNPGTDVYGKEIPGLPGNDPFFQIYENITLSPAGLKAEISGLLIAQDRQGTLHFRIVPYKDAIVTVIISPDNMSASLILESEIGEGKPLTKAMALAALKDKGIQGTIDTDAIDKTLAEIRKSKQNTEVIVVRAQKPVQSGSSRITWITHVSEDTKRTDIKAGDQILSTEKLPSGADGFDVFGTQLKASTAEAETAPECDDTIIVEKAGNALVYVASISGELELQGNKLSISDTKEIFADIDEKTGDVSFSGNLVLSGNIKNGRTVKATGVLTISGDAEASLVSSDVSVTMHGGIKGRGKGTVWAKQTVHLEFAENARILAGQDISIDNHCFECTIKTNGMHLMKGNPAILLGGNIRASRGVEVFELGSEKNIRTSISFGQNYLIGDQIEVCEKEVRTIQETVKKIDEEMKKTASTDPRIHELRQMKLEQLKKSDKLTVRIFMLKEQFETHIISHIKVENTVYPGVILESHGRYYEVRKPASHVIFIFDQTTGQITCSPIEI